MSLSEVKTLDKTRSIDLVGIVHTVDPVGSCQLRSGQVKDKRMISICDESGFFIQACFWAEQAHAFDNLSDHPVVACKNIRVVEYGGRSLN